MFTNLENFLANLCFVTLFFSVVFYWVQTTNIALEDPKTQTPENLGSLTSPQKISYPDVSPQAVPPKISLVAKLKERSLPQKNFFLGTLGVFFSNICLMLLLLLRWKESGHFPLSNLYESLMFLSWGFTVIHLFIEIKIYSGFNLLASLMENFKGFKVPKNFSSGELGSLNCVKTKKQFVIGKFIGCITSPIALFTNAFATLSLPKEMQGAAPLVPALQSNWLMMHVTVMILSYAALILGSLLSIAFLILTSTPINILGSPYKSFTVPVANNNPNNNPNNNIDSKNFLPLVPSVYKLIEGSTIGSKEKNKVNEKEFLASFNFLNNSGGELGSYNIELSTSTNTSPESSLLASPIKILEEKEYIANKFIVSNNLSNGNAYKKGTTSSLEKLAKTLDNLSYRILGIGFPFLTIGILSGAVWANEAWGSYWSWDPKETWALLTWLVFAIYLHTRLTKGWEGKKPAIIASLGFVTVWICFLGVNLIGEGLHSYGWLVKS